MDILLVFYNGDQMRDKIGNNIPPGVLEWVDTDKSKRMFWLDRETWAEKQMAVYREVASGVV